MAFVYRILLNIVISILAVRLSPKPDAPSAGTLNDLGLPTADPGRSSVVWFGREVIEDATVGWYGDLRTKRIREGNSLTGKSTIGYRYYCGAQFFLGHGPVDKLHRIIYGEREAFNTEVSGDQAGLYIDEPALFGGRKQEGGIQGYFDFIAGSYTHERNSYLTSQLGQAIPAFRGQAQVVFNQTYWSAMSPYIKKIGFDVTNLHAYDTWYPAVRSLGNDMNLAHITRQLLINPVWGMGKNPTRLDNASFIAFADQCAEEGVYISIRWGDDTGSIESFLEVLKEHGDFFLFLHPVTGLYTVSTSRDKYVLANTPLFDESNSNISSHDKSSYGINTPNQVTLIFRDRDNVDVPVTLDNMANIQRQGRVINETLTLPGVRTAELATRLARRNLDARSVPAETAQLDVFFRDAYNIVPGSVVRVTSARAKLNALPMRVLEVNRGGIGDSKISLSVVEDVFKMPSADIVVDQSSLFVDPATPPVDVTQVSLHEASYYQVRKQFAGYEIAEFTPGFGLPFVVAIPPAGYSQDYVIYSTTNTDTTGNYTENNDGDYCPYCTLDNALDRGPSSVNLEVSNMRDMEEATLPQLAYIDNELVAVTAINIGGGQITIERGLMDTIPEAHAEGSYLYLIENEFGMSIYETLDNQTAWIRLVSRNGSGELDLASATGHSILMNDRYSRPYPPGNVQINNSYFPQSVLTDITATWAHRDKTLQLDSLDAWTSNNIGPEAGTTYTVRLYDNNTEALLNEVTGLTTPSYTYTLASELADHGVIHDQIRIEIEAELAGVSSLQIYTHIFAHT